MPRREKKREQRLLLSNMTPTNTYISNDCTRQVLVYVDKNGHYHIMRYRLDRGMMLPYRKGKEDYKHFHSAERASLSFIK